MKQKLTLLLLALVTSIGAWATTYTVTLGSQVTDVSTLSTSKYYVLKNCGSSLYNYYDGSQMDAKSGYDYSCVVSLNYDGTNVTIKQVSTDTYYQGLVSNTRLTLGADAVSYTFNTDGVESGQFRFANNSLYMNRNDSGYPIGYSTDGTGDYSLWNIYEVNVMDFVGKTFTLQCARGYVYYNGSVLAGTNDAASASKFAIVSYDENTYLYDATQKAFVCHTTAATAGITGNAALESNNDFSKIVKYISFGSTEIDSYPYYVQENEFGNWLNMDGTPSVYFNTWKEFESGNGGNTYAIAVVDNTFDATVATEMLNAYFNPSATVQYVISDANGVVFTSEELPATIGETLTELPSDYQRPYCNYSVTSTTIAAGENTVNVTVTYNLPFTVSTSFEDATWYYATIRNTKYLRADDNNKDGSGRYSTNSSNERTDVYKWAFFGNPYSYFYIANKGQCEGKYLNAGTVPTFETIASPATTDAALWEAITNGSGFTLRSITGTNLYINDAGGNGNLGYWDSTNGRTDAGGLWTVEEVTTSDKNALAQAITEAQVLVAAPGVPGYPTAEATSTLNGVLSSAQTVYADASGDYGAAYISLSSAIATAKNNINYTPRTDVYYTITSERGSMIYDSSHDSSVDGGGNKFLWYTTSPDNTNVNHLWGFIEKDGNYYMYNVGKKQFATVSTTGGYQSGDKGTWVFSDTPAYVTFDAGINNSVAAPYVRVRATVATTETTYSMSISTNYTGPVITYDAQGDGGIPMVLATSTVAVDAVITAEMTAKVEDLTPFYAALNAQITAAEAYSIGSGLGQYTDAGTFATALSTAKTTYANKDVTKAELQQATTDLTAAISALTYNMPNGKFIRLKNTSVSGYSYVGTAASGKAPLVAGVEDAGIYFVTEDNKIVSYGRGKYLSTDAGAQCTVTGEATFTIGDGGNGTYTFYYGGQGYLIAWTSGYTDRWNSVIDNARFTVEEVTELPVTINSISGRGFASFYSPVAISSLPSDVEAYIATIENNRVKFSAITDIPANTGVVLYMPSCEVNTTVNLTIGNASASTTGNVLIGTAAAVARDEQEEVLTMQVVNDELGFYKFNGEYLAGFKAYINNTSGIKGFAFDFEDDATGMSEELRMKNEESKSAIYNLAGQRLNKPVKGINIVNGKKVMVK